MYFVCCKESSNFSLQMVKFVLIFFIINNMFIEKINFICITYSVLFLKLHLKNIFFKFVKMEYYVYL